MARDSKAGVTKQVAGSLKEAIGKITGDTETQAEGVAEKRAGEVRRSTDDANKSSKNN